MIWLLPVPRKLLHNAMQLIGADPVAVAIEQDEDGIQFVSIYRTFCSRGKLLSGDSARCQSPDCAILHQEEITVLFSNC
jgi:hypothetical protein